MPARLLSGTIGGDAIHRWSFVMPSDRFPTATMADQPSQQRTDIKPSRRPVEPEPAGLIDDEDKLPFLERAKRFWTMVIQNFMQNRCPVRATALAYTTLLSLVPLLAVVVSISTSLLKTEEGDKRIDAAIDLAIENLAPQLGLVPQTTNPPSRKEMEEENLLDSLFGPDEERTPIRTEAQVEAQADARSKVSGFIKESIKKVNSGALGATAIIGVIFVGISLLANIEATLNDIWGVTRGRSWFARIVQYWAVLSLGPLLLLVAASVAVGAQTEWVQIFFKQPVVKFLFNLLPLVIVAAGLALFYKLMPNTKVEWRAAFVGGAVAALLWGLNNQLNVLYFEQVVRNSKIYGSLGILPIFLIGLYLSWLMLLFGAQVAYAFQNRKAYLHERLADSVNHITREFIALRLMTSVAHRFNAGDPPPTLIELSDQLAVPSRLLLRIIQPLTKSGLIVEVRNITSAFAPGRPLESISYGDILQSIRSAMGQNLSTREGPEREKVQHELDLIREAEARAAAGVTLASVVRS